MDYVKDFQVTSGFPLTTWEVGKYNKCKILISFLNTLIQ